jgi:hypothetical protein
LLENEISISNILACAETPVRVEPLENPPPKRTPRPSPMVI